jgi:hypothetical protein
MNTADDGRGILLSFKQCPRGAIIMSCYVLTIISETVFNREIYADAYESELHTDGSASVDFLNQDGEIITEVRVSAHHSVLIRLVQ